MASNASRYFFMFLIGLLVGSIATVMGVRALQARKDPFPESAMHVMQKQGELLKQNAEQSRCAATDSLPRLQALRMISNDLEIAFPGLADDRRFTAHASNLRATLNTAIGMPPSDCVLLDTVNAKVGEACKACHQDFRG